MKVEAKILVDNFGSYEKGDKAIFEKSTAVALETRKIIKITGDDILSAKEKADIKKAQDTAEKAKSNKAVEGSEFSAEEFEEAVAAAVEAKLGPAVEAAVEAALEASLETDNAGSSE